MISLTCFRKSCDIPTRPRKARIGPRIGQDFLFYSVKCEVVYRTRLEKVFIRSEFTVLTSCQGSRKIMFNNSQLLLIYLIKILHKSDHPNKDLTSFQLLERVSDTFPVQSVGEETIKRLDEGLLGVYIKKNTLDRTCHELWVKPRLLLPSLWVQLSLLFGCFAGFQWYRTLEKIWHFLEGTEQISLLLFQIANVREEGLNFFS